MSTDSILDFIDALAKRESARYAHVTPRIDGSGYSVTLRRKQIDGQDGLYESRREWRTRTKAEAEQFQAQLPNAVQVEQVECKGGRLIVQTGEGTIADRYFRGIMLALAQPSLTPRAQRLLAKIAA